MAGLAQAAISIWQQKQITLPNISCNIQIKTNTSKHHKTHKGMCYCWFSLGRTSLSKLNITKMCQFKKKKKGTYKLKKKLISYKVVTICSFRSLGYLFIHMVMVLRAHSH